MSMSYASKMYKDFYNTFNPETPASKALIPLLDALNWKGDNSRIKEALVSNHDQMDIEGLISSMANLKFKHIKIEHFKAVSLKPNSLPLLVLSMDKLYILLNFDKDQSMIFDCQNECFTNMPLDDISGTAYFFQYAGDLKDSLIHQQNNWFNKLLYRFSSSFKSIAFTTLLITLMNLVIPLFIMLIYGQMNDSDSVRKLLIIFLGIVAYILLSIVFTSIRSTIINFVSTRMGYIISQQTFTRLMYLAPSYTENASINSQINRIKDFENLKRFVTSGIFINILELVFSSIYIIAIFIIAGWIAIVPVITLVIVFSLGHFMRPFHKIKMERKVDSSSERQQNLIEMLKNTTDIKITGQKDFWMERFKKATADNIYDNYQLSNYVSTTNNISYFITNASVLIVIYGGVHQVFNGRMNTGALIGILLLYWKILSSIRGAFSLSVQVNGLKKSINQINRFMKLPQDSHLSTNMTNSNNIKGNVRFMDVSIKYNQNSSPALINLNFNALPGEIVSFAGHDGAGKSTVLKLILNMYKAQGGRILLDNVNIKQLEPLSLRQSIGYAPEKDIIFATTIRDNFKYYNPSISDESILDLMNKTGLIKYMTMFNYSLDTHFTEGDLLNCSLAFKKLFNLTRLLSRDVKLYLVDEPENYLSDNEVKNLVKLFQDISMYKKATFIISTKNSFILDSSSKVIELNEGRKLRNNSNRNRRYDNEEKQ